MSNDKSGPALEVLGLTLELGQEIGKLKEQALSGATTGFPGTLRRYYIGQALAGLCANPDVTKGVECPRCGHDRNYIDTNRAAIKQADDLLARLEDES